MKVLVLLLFFWLGVAFTHGKRKREPRNCGRGGTLRITSLQPQGRNENQWAVGYHGNMFRAVVSYDHVHKITWKVEYGDRNENYVFNWEDWDTGYIASIENTRNGAFKASKPKVDTENEKAESTISVNKATNIDQVKLTFTTDHVEACSITNIIFKKCQTEHSLLVNSSSSTFSSGGNFYCDKGFDLFPINQNTRTTCSANGKWINSHEFKCYRAPDDTHIVGNLMIKEHEKMEISCKFTQTTPPASKFKIFFGNQTFEKSLEEPFTRNITIEDDGKMIWCQPISSYTKTPQFSKKGKSPTRQLRVLFAPKSINNDSNLTCDWIIGNDGNSSCDFTFLSRPSADNISLFLVKNESDVKVEFKFSNSSLGRNQTITITQIENNHLSSQRFRLQVISSLFPESLLTFPFDLNIKRNVYSGETQPKILKSSQVTIIIGIVAGAVVIVLLISLVFVIQRRKMRSNNGALSNEAVAEDRINDIYETADDVRGGNSVREERCNVIYNSGFTGTKDESVREERCNVLYEGGDYGAEEKVNPLYGAALNQVPTKKTSNKNKHQATSNSYKQNIHSLNESDHVYASVVESKTTKKKKKTSIQNHQNINDSEQTYASVDVTKKKKKELKHKTSPKTNQNLNDSAHYAPADLSQEKKTKLKRETTLQDHPSVTDSAQLYSSIDTSKKKANKNVPATSESLNDSDQLYASVDVSKKTGKNLR